MTVVDRGTFADLMFAVGELYGESLSDTRVELYLAALEDLDLADLRTALTAHVRTSKFFPRPSEIREAVQGSAEDRAEMAWVALLAMVRRCGAWWQTETQGPLPWPDDATRCAALNIFGSWRHLCETLPASGPEFLGVAKQFKAAFGAYARREMREGVLPPSHEEARMRLHGLQQELAARGLPTGQL